MRKINASLIVVSVLAFSGLLATGAMAQSAPAACEPDKVAEKYPSLAGKTIRIGQDGESAPFSMRDPDNFENLVGLDADTAREVFGCAGIPVEFVTGSWSGLIPAVMAGQIDVMWDTLLYTPERAKGIDFVYYMNAATGFLVAKGNPHAVKGLDDLCGLTATAGLGTTQEAMVREASDKCVADGKPAITVVPSSDIPSGLRLIENGRADVAASSKFLVDAMAKSSDTVEVAFGVTTDAKLAAGVTKGNSDLIKAIDDGLVVLRANGKLKEIFDKYGVDYSLVTDPQILTE